MKKTIPMALALALAATALPASAQFEKPEDAIKYRQSAFTILGNHFGRLGAMAQGKMKWDEELAKADADVVTMAVRLPWAAFGSGTDAGAKTAAKAGIWKNEDKFADLWKASEKAVDDELMPAMKTNDIKQIRAAVGKVGQTCKACHDDYREK